LGLILAVTVQPARADSVPDRLSIEPGSIKLEGAQARQQVAVTGHFADGSVRDLTTVARFATEPIGIADVSPIGVVTPKSAGQARLLAIASGRIAEATIVVSDAGRVRPASYRLDISALLSKGGCNAGTCHGNLSGKGGFRLSLRGDDPVFDL